MKVKIKCTITHTIEVEANSNEEALEKANIVDVEKDIMEKGSENYEFSTGEKQNTLQIAMDKLDEANKLLQKIDSNLFKSEKDCNDWIYSVNETLEDLIVEIDNLIKKN
jgi:hypothetical protein